MRRPSSSPITIRQANDQLKECVAMEILHLNDSASLQGLLSKIQLYSVRSVQDLMIISVSPACRESKFIISGNIPVSPEETFNF